MLRWLQASHVLLAGLPESGLETAQGGVQGRGCPSGLKMQLWVPAIRITRKCFLGSSISLDLFALHPFQ